MNEFVKKNRFLLVVFFLALLLRIPSLFEPYWYGDEGVYLTIGLALRKGLVLYKEIYDNKPPLIYLLAGLSGNLFCFRFLLLLFAIGEIIIFNELIKIFFSRKPFVQKIGLFIFTVFLSLPLIEGNIANAEIFQILPTLFGFWILLRKKKPEPKDFFISGLSFGLSALFKIPAVFDLAALIIFLLFFSQDRTKKRKYLFMPVGFLAPFLLTFLFLWRINYLTEGFKIIFLQNLGYLSSWQTGSHQFSLFKSGLVLKILLFLFFIGLLIILKHKSKNRIKFSFSYLLLIWFAAALFAVSLSGRPYSHYLIQILAPFSLLVGLLLYSELAEKIFILLLMGVFFVFCHKTKFWFYPVFSYYRNFFLYVTKSQSYEDYLRGFSPNLPDFYQTVKHISSTTKSDGKIFVWSDEPQIYVLTKKTPVGKFTTAYHIIDFDKCAETIQKVQTQNPEIIVVDKTKKNFPELNNLLFNQYLPIATYGQWNLYRRRNIML